MRAQINELENKETLEKITETKRCFSEINKIDKPLGRLSRKKI